ncbi:MAG: hypothetical protein GX625_18315, partial [Clostridiaceae bacterium]|nr:hypothetical protein [Clostridiaceae bacterium]
LRQIAFSFANQLIPCFYKSQLRLAGWDQDISAQHRPFLRFLPSLYVVRLGGASIRPDNGEGTSFNLRPIILEKTAAAPVLLTPGESCDIVNYDRGWDIKPIDEVKEVYTIILGKYN